jgi:hypothetical protein|tara:strand:+ start:144 stop:869 length:726 start_codon:yes stop_codon:yes gene_type:complete
MPAVTHSNTPFASNVFVNGGPTLGGAIADALGLEDTVGIDDGQARAIISGRAVELDAGNDPDTMEALEQFGGGSPNGTNPINGKEGAEAAPGSDLGTGPDGADSDEFPRPESEWIIVGKHVNPRVLPDVWNKAIVLAQSIGRPITLNSAYRTPEYNAKVGGAKKSMHVQRMAIDVQWGTTNQQARVDMIQRAVDAGFTGIGCYTNFMHLDIGPKRQWGPSGSRTSQYASYKPILSTNGFNV